MNSKVLLEALSFAADKHRKQRRKDVIATPYINHPIQVAYVLSSVGKVEDEDVLASALLHDTVEDTDTTIDELTANFGERISNIVADLTVDKYLSKEERKRIQIDHAASISMEATFVLLGDLICNVSDVKLNPPSDWDIDRKRQYFEWAAAVINNCPRVDTPLFSLFQEKFEAGLKSLL